MQKTIIALLILLVLGLSAALVRVQDRERRMEERLAAAEHVRPSKPASPLPPPPEEPVVPSHARDPVEPKAPASKTQTPPSTPTEPMQVLSNGPVKMTYSRMSWALPSELRLTDAQKKMILDLRRSAELQTLAYRELEQKIEAQTEEAIRGLLDPQQLQAYDAMKSPQMVQVYTPPQEEPLPSGRRPGYLGITGLDAQGGGVQLTSVQPGTVAGYSGLQAGDVILEVNGEKVASYSDLATRVRQSGEGGPVTLRIRRGASEFYQGVQLGQRP